jgi:predicted MFS family arabinose efflux permease
MANGVSGEAGTRKGRIACAIALYTAGGLFWAFLPFFVTLQIGQAGLSATSAGLLGTGYLAGFTLSSVAAIWWTRAFDMRAVIAFALLLVIAGFSILGVSGGFALSLACCLLIGCAMAALWVVAYRVIAQSPAAERNFAAAIGISYPALALITFLASHVVVPHAGLVGVLLTIAALVAILGLGGIGVPAKLDAPTASAGGAGSGRFSAGLLALTSLLLVGFAFACIWSFAGKLGADAGFDDQVVGTILSSNLLLTGIGSLGATAIGNRFGRLPPILASLILMGLCMAMLLLRPGLAAFAFSICGLGLAMGVAMPFQLAAIATDDRDGRLVSLIAAVQGGGTALAPPLAGLVLESHGPAAIALIGLLSVSAGLGCSILSHLSSIAKSSVVK